MALRSAWNFDLIYGGMEPVTIPVGLAPATPDGANANNVSFKKVCTVEDEDNGTKCLTPLKQPSTCEEHGVLDADAIGKGLVIDKKMRFVDPELMEAITMESSTNVTITEFVPVSEVPDLYRDRAYYLLPTGKNAESYSSLFYALEETGLGGLTRYVRATKEYLAIVEPVGGILGLHTLYAYEDVKWSDDILVNVGKKERKMQTDILRMQSDSFDPQLLTYHYRLNLKEVVDSLASPKKRKKVEPVVSVAGSLESQLERTLAALKKAA